MSSGMTDAKLTASPGTLKPQSLPLHMSLRPVAPDNHYDHYDPSVKITPPTPSRDTLAVSGSARTSIADSASTLAASCSTDTLASPSRQPQLAIKTPLPRNDSVYSRQTVTSSRRTTGDSRGTEQDIASSEDVSPATTPIEGVDHEAAKAWSDCARAMMEYDEATVKRWKEEIDTLLVFAGLFSAVVTAFLIESCNALHPESTDRVVDILIVISAQLHNVSVESLNLESNVNTRFVPSDKAPFVNALWFTSLISSLAVALVGLLVKQWLGEYTAGLMTVSRSRVSKKHAHARQHRHDALRKWRVKTIMTALPLILQFALILFLLGLTELLIALNHRVGKAILTFFAVIVAFILATSILPTFFKDCPYRSPQALVFYVLGQTIIWTTRLMLRQVHSLLTRISTASAIHPSLRRFAACCNAYAAKRTLWSWECREDASLLVCQDAYEANMLDELDEVKMDLAILQSVVRPCLRTLPLDVALRCVRHIMIRRADQVTPEHFPCWTHDLDRETLYVLVDILLDMLERELPTPSGSIASPADFDDGAADRVWQTLRILKNIVLTCDHYNLLEGRYDRFFNTLIVYRRKSTNIVVIRKLIYILLASCSPAITPTAGTLEDVASVIDYALSESAQSDFEIDRRAPVYLGTLALNIMRQHPIIPTDDLTPSEDMQLQKVMELLQGSLDVETAIQGSPDLHELEEYMCAIHKFLATFEGLLEACPDMPATNAWDGVRHDIRKLADTYARLNKGPYVDAYGIFTEDRVFRIDDHQPRSHHLTDVSDLADRLPTLNASLTRPQPSSSMNLTSTRRKPMRITQSFCKFGAAKRVSYSSPV